MIEFVGLPGSGKSVLCASLASSLIANGISRDLRVLVLMDHQPKWLVQQRKLIDATRFVARHPATARRALRIVIASRQSRTSAAITKTINLWAELWRAEADHISLSEQGVLQALWSIEFGALESKAPELLAAVDAWLPQTAIVVAVSPDENLRRLRHRSNGRSRLEGDRAADSALEKGRHDLERLIDLWRSGGDNRLPVWLDVVDQGDPARVIRPHLHTIGRHLAERSLVKARTKPSNG